MLIITSALERHPYGAVQWLCGSGHKAQPLLRPSSQTSQVFRDALAASRSDRDRAYTSL